MTNNKISGTIVAWIASKGYGFCRPDGGCDPDCFIHIKSVSPARDSLEVGQRVLYNIASDNQGRPRARDVELI